MVVVVVVMRLVSVLPHSMFESVSFIVSLYMIIMYLPLSHSIIDLNLNN